MSLTQRERQVIHDLARASVEYGLSHGVPMPCAEQHFAPHLREARASFVTLRHGGALLGCIGTLRPHRPLVRDVVHNSFHAAFSDPRFPPLNAAQLPRLDIHVSILSELTPVQAKSRSDLLRQLRPGVDGLVIEEGGSSATFLPVMWARLPDPRAFLHALQEKAGLPVGSWSSTLRAFRYTVEDA